MLDVVLNERQTKSVLRRLDRFAAEIGDLKPANRLVAIQLYSWVLNNFNNEGSFVGGWTPLADSTVREKQRIGKERMMVRSGTLRNSFTSFYSKDDAGVGSELEYAVYHESDEPRTGNLPRRQMLPSRGTVLEIGVKVYQSYIGRATKKANNK